MNLIQKNLVCKFFIHEKKERTRLQKLRERKSEIKDKEAIKAIKRGEKVTNYNEYQLD